MSDIDHNDNPSAAEMQVDETLSEAQWTLLQEWCKDPFRTRTQIVRAAFPDYSESFVNKTTTKAFGPDLQEYIRELLKVHTDLSEESSFEPPDTPTAQRNREELVQLYNKNIDICARNIAELSKMPVAEQDTVMLTHWMKNQNDNTKALAALTGAAKEAEGDALTPCVIVVPRETSEEEFARNFGVKIFEEVGGEIVEHDNHNVAEQRRKLGPGRGYPMPPKN